MEFINCAQRGLRRAAPENTIASFELAVEHGANEIELDLRLSRDGTIVVMHDATVDRTTNGTGGVHELTYDELRALDAGGGARIPTFDEVLDAVDVRLQVHLKDPAVIEPLRTLLTRRRDDRERISPCSFDLGCVSVLADQLPGCVVGLVRRTGRRDVVLDAEAHGARRVVFGWTGMDADLVAFARDRGVHCSVWPVNTAEQLHDAVALGVDGFTTDHPSLLFDHGYAVHDGALVLPSGV
ncbi:glycerophosphodiester phosphodiesterase [Phytoactinopolyspora halophila]|uniref:glycerophosphodiester phosphodiesterase n=1 Tax=Phytoactinopolyspora halophila TaxID=1981511 RepID=UPI001314429F|nr:glycerophosphodiester phosphodiesterase family protein [Phytoactinopolyspora halophila]